MCMASKRVHRGLLFSFLALSLADLYFTRQLFAQDDSTIAETNPVAQWILINHGWIGVTFFKLSSVLLVAMLMVAVARRRPRTAARLLTGSCLLLGGVVFYSGLLLYVPEVVSAEIDTTEDELYRRNLVLDAAIADSRARWRLKSQLARELVAKRRTLAEAVTAIQRLDVPESPRMGHLRWLYPGCNDEQCLAINVMEFALTQHRTDLDGMKLMLSELARAYEASYGAAVPAYWWTVGERVVSNFFRPATAADWEPPTSKRGSWRFQKLRQGDV